MEPGFRFSTGLTLLKFLSVEEKAHYLDIENVTGGFCRSSKIFQCNSASFCYSSRLNPVKDENAVYSG